MLMPVPLLVMPMLIDVTTVMREQLKGQELSFTDMAKVVGEKWQLLSADSRELYEKRAGTMKETFNTEFTSYKKTERYSQYQDYLAEFKAKNGQQEGNGSTILLREYHPNHRRWETRQIGTSRVDRVYR
jgi:hypothetical protein